MKISDIEHLDNLLLTQSKWRGVNSKVYDLGLCVLKVFKNDPAYLMFLDFIESVGYNKHLPKIYDHIIYKDMHLVLIEKLDRISDEGLSFRQQDAEIQGWHERDICPWLWIEDSLDKVLYVLEKYCQEALEDLSVEWDLHGKNIMERNGVLVITDPWCCNYTSVVV